MTQTYPGAVYGRLISPQVHPDFDAVGNGTALPAAIGALLTIVLICSVLMLIVSAAIWGMSTSAGNHQGTAKGRAGVFVSLLAAALAGAGVAWMNFLLNLGSTI